VERLNTVFQTKINAFLLVVLAVIFLLFDTSLSCASDIIAVKSSSLKPYNDALDGFRSTGTCAVRELNLAETGQQPIQEITRGTDADAVPAIGKDTLLSVLKIDTVPVFDTTVTWFGPDFETPPNNLSGNSMDIPPDTYLSTMSRLLPRAKEVYR